MKRSIRFFSLVISILISTSLLAQNGFGTLKGKITDKETSEALPFVNVIIKVNDSIVAGANSDFDGIFEIKNLKPGSYTLKFSYVGYTSLTINNVKINSNQITFLNHTMSSEGGVVLNDIVVAEYSEPLIQKDNNTSGGLIRGSRGRGKVRKYRSVQWLSGAPEQNTEEYSDYDEVGFRSPINRALSTFSIDVDAASYSICRKNLTDGDLPPQDAVRIEEMINYFNYDYKAPEGEVPFSLNTELSECSWNKNHQLALIGIKGKVIDTKDLPKSNLVFLLDVSGSMDYSNKLPLLKKSMNLLVNNLTENDKISIVVYAGSAGVVLQPTSGDKKDKIFDAIERLSAGGSTAGGQGIELAYKLASKNFINNGNNRVILATDGDFNVGISSEDGLQKLIEEKRESGIYLSVLGFGEGNIKDNKMEKLADYGNGNYSYIDNLLEAQKVLISEMGGTLLTIAKDVKIQVEFNPEKVRAYRLVGYETRLLQDEDFNNDEKDAGELGAGQDVTALYEIIPFGTEEDIPGLNIDSLKYQKVKVDKNKEYYDEILTVKLRYKLPKEKKSELITSVIKDEVTPLNNSSENLRFASAVAQYGMLLRNSEFKGDSNYDNVIELAQSSRNNDTEGYKAEFIRLVNMAKLLSDDGQTKK